MPASPADAEDLARAVGLIYQDAEAALLEILARALADGIESPRWAELKLRSIGNVRHAVEEVTNALRDDADGAIGRVVHEAYARGGQSAVAELGMLPEGLRAAAARHLPGARNVDRLANEALDNTRPIYRRILRAVPDAYRSIVQRVSGSVLLGGLTRRQATQRALDQLAARGITGFVDRAGRNWSMASYAEMAVRSVAGRAAIQGHIDRLQEVGQELVIVSDAPLECPLCAPWEGEVLAINGQSGPHTLVEEHATRDGVPVTVHVAGSLPEARAAGLFHPNAILGNQECRALGDVENAARAWYEGPSVHLTTARGKRLTVSPNHPVLTTTGWLPAERVREGMHVLSGPTVKGNASAAPAAEDLHDAPTSFEEVFDALAAHGLRTSVTAAGDDFHGDGRSYKGEVSVVWAEGALLDELDSLSIQQARELVFARPGVELESLAGPGALFPCGHRVSRAVAGPLADLDAVGFESSPERRLADAEEVGEILAGLACGVTPDQVVNVDRNWYRGHAYDLQTSSGAYLTADIVVHNCRHSLSLYLPGVTTRPKAPPHPQGATYEDTQRQRYYERQVRAWKRRAAAALDDDARKRANGRVRDYQAAIRQLTEEKGLRRKREREQLPTVNAPKPADQARDDALRIRADADAAHRMTDEQLAAAAGSGHLRPQDVAAVQAAADQRDLDELLARVRPGGRMAADLTGVGDDDLAKVLPHLSPEEALRVAAEMDRRDADAALPGARRDLIGLSDEQLGERARHATGEELAALAAEADRRQLLAQVFPGGRLADDLTGLDDDTLGWAVRYATLDDAERIAAEFDRRYPVDLPEARGAATVAGQLADRAALDEVLAPAAPLDDWAHLRDLPDDDPYAGMSPTERWIAERDAADEARRGAYTREQVREMYAEHVYAQWLDAEDWCRGYLLTKRAELDGVDPRSLFSGPSHVAYARASEELKRYWSEVAPRLTFAEYHEQLTGIRSAAADTARKAKGDQGNRF